MAAQPRIRVGLVGVGNWGRYGHLPALRLLPEYDIVAVSSRTLETASALAETFDIHTHSETSDNSQSIEKWIWSLCFLPRRNMRLS
jgi:predicted dehydrogenase